MSPRVSRIPADVDRPDRLLAGLTARQLGIITAAAILAWMLGLAASLVVPLPVAAGLVTPLLAAGLVLALGRAGGLSADRLVLAALSYHRRPRRLVPAPDGVAAPPPWAATGRDGGGLPAPLELPARDLHANGVIDLGEHGAALLCRASALNFSLRTDTEQQALVAAFTRFLHSVTAPVQVLVRAQRADLDASIDELERGAGGLPHPALEAAAHDHAGFLAGLAARRDVLRRELLVCFREPGRTPNAGGLLLRRAEEAASLLAAAGITLTPLDQATATTVLAQAADPEVPPRSAGLAGPNQIITSRGRAG